MKIFLEIVLAFFLHPVATVLMWVNLAGRKDLNDTQKIIWAVSGLLVIVPIVYVVVGDGELW